MERFAVALIDVDSAAIFDQSSVQADPDALPAQHDGRRQQIPSPSRASQIASIHRACHNLRTLPVHTLPAIPIPPGYSPQLPGLPALPAASPACHAARHMKNPAPGTRTLPDTPKHPGYI